MHIIIATDSRGRGLKEFVRENHPQWNCTVLVRPGATINVLHNAIRQNFKYDDNNNGKNGRRESTRPKYALIIFHFFAGICKWIKTKLVVWMKDAIVLV